MSEYTVLIEAAAPNTPITLADRDTLTEREIVGYRAADWQRVAPPETITGTSAGEVAAEAAAAQEVTTGVWRVRVWEGADADLGTAPDAEVYSDES